MHKNKHIKAYSAYFGAAPPNGRICELTGLPGAEITHIRSAGMSADVSRHKITNLMALRPEMHSYFGDKQEFYEFLSVAHKEFMLTKVPYYLQTEDQYDVFMAACIVSYGKVLKKE